jgi:hypothetical protein
MWQTIIGLWNILFKLGGLIGRQRQRHEYRKDIEAIKADPVDEFDRMFSGVRDGSAARKDADTTGKTGADKTSEPGGSDLFGR